MKKQEWERALREALERIEQATGSGAIVSLDSLIQSLFTVRLSEMVEEYDALSVLKGRGEITTREEHLREYLRTSLEDARRALAR